MRPNILLIDLDLPDQLALDLTRHFHDQIPGPHVILLTHGTSQDGLLECFTSGAHGCVPEDSSLQDLCEAIEKVAAGEIFCSHGVVHSMFHRMAEKSKDGRRDHDDSPTLTSRELEVVGLVAEHLSNKQIARRLSVSLYTVKNHIHNIVDKLDVSGRYEAVDFARKHRLLGPTKAPAAADREG
jgi:DNA-binding NarL/FixJ family response regulator